MWTKMLALALVLTTTSAAAVMADVTREAPLHAVRPAVIATLKTGESAELVGTDGGWYRIRVRDEAGAEVEGFVAVNAAAKKGGEITALHDAPVYATSKAVMATVPAGAMVELVEMIGESYQVRYTLESGEIVEGLVAPGCLAQSDAVRVWRDEQAVILADRARKKAEAAALDALYQQWRYKYAVVEGEYVRLPEFDLRRASSDPKGGTELPGWKVGAFGHVSRAEIKEVFGPACALARARIYYDAVVWSGGGGVTFGTNALRGLESKPDTVRRPDDETIMLTGWSMANVADGQMLWIDEEGRRTDAYVAIIGNRTYKTPIGARQTVLRAIPLVQVRRGLTREEFNGLLLELQKKKTESATR